MSIGPRRTGRTTALVDAAFRMTGHNQFVFFVVHHHGMIDCVRTMLRGRVDRAKDMDGRRVEVIVFDQRRGATGYLPGPAVYDHLVTEELLHKAHPREEPARQVKVQLDINGWFKPVAIPAACYESGFYRMVMQEPMSWMARYGEEVASDVATAVATKVVEFHRTCNTKGGLTIFTSG